MAGDGMGGIAAPIGGGSSIKVNGRQYILHPTTLQDFGFLSNRLAEIKRARLIADAKAIAEDEPLEVKRVLLGDARKEASAMPEPSMPEVEAWAMGTPAGMAYFVWLKIEQHYPGEVDEESIYKELIKLAEENFEDFRTKAAASAGTAHLGESLPPGGSPVDAGGEKPALRIHSPEEATATT